MLDWEGLSDALRHQPYSSRVEHGAWQITELLQTASASRPPTQGRLALSKQDLAQALSNEPRYWATAGALVQTEEAIAATAEHVERLAASGGLRHMPHRGLAAYWAGALAYAQSLGDDISNGSPAQQLSWDPLKATLRAVEDRAAFEWAFPSALSTQGSQLVAERLHWLPFLLHLLHERIGHDLARYNPDTDMLRRAASVAAAASEAHNSSLAVQRSALALQDQIRAAWQNSAWLDGDGAGAGVDFDVPGDAAAVPAASAAGSAAALPASVLQWATRGPGSDAVEFCSLQGPHALQVLASGTQDSPHLLRAWQAACTAAETDPPGALEAWLDYMHCHQAAGMALDQLLGILLHPVHDEAHHGLLLATRAFTAAWQAGDVSMQCWQVEDVSKLAALSAHAVHLFLQQEAKALSSGLAADLPEAVAQAGMDVDCDAVPDTPEHEEDAVMEERAVSSAPVYRRIPGLTAAIAANPAAAADYAAAAIVSMLDVSSAGGSWSASVLGALTSALAPAGAATQAAVHEKISASLAECPRAIAAGCSSAGGVRLQAQPIAVAAPQVRCLAVAAVLSRQVDFVGKLQSACQAQERAEAGTDSALSSVLAPEEQSALLHHLLLCTSAPGACNILEVWAALQPLCGCYCQQQADKNNAGLLPSLPHWLVAQVNASSAGTGLPVLPDSLAIVCYGHGHREPVSAALAKLRGGPCDAAAERLLQAIDKGLLSWLMSGAEVHQVPEEAWAAQSMEAAAQHIVSALCGDTSATRRAALLLVTDSVGSKSLLAPAISFAAAARCTAEATTMECMTAVEVAVRRLCALEAPQSLNLQRLVSSLTVALSDKGMDPQCNRLPLCMLQQLAAGCPHAVIVNKCYPQLLQELLRRAVPECGNRKSPDFAGGGDASVNSRSCEQTLLVQQAAMRCIASLAAHDKRAMQDLVDLVVPAALADSSELRWQSTLAHCRSAINTRSSTFCSPSGEGNQEAPFSMQRLISRLKGVEKGAAAGGSVTQARRLCRLALLNASVSVA